MKRRKPRYDPRLLSFTFEVMADHIERIREENVSDTPQEAVQGLVDGTLPLAAAEPAPRESSYAPDQLLAQLKANRDQSERDALHQGKVPVLDARLEEKIVKLEQQIEVVQDKEAAPEEPKSNVLRFAKEGEPNTRYRYHTHAVEGGHRLVRTLLNPHVGSLTSVFHSDGHWYGTHEAPRGGWAKPVAYRTVDWALSVAQQDARERGLTPEGGEKQLSPPGEAQQANVAETTREVFHDRRTDSAAGNRPAHPSARNNPPDQIGRVSQLSLFDTGQVGAELPGHAAGLGSERRNLPHYPAGTANDPGSEDAGLRHGLRDEAAWDEPVGDFGTTRSRYRVENYRM